MSAFDDALATAAVEYAAAVKRADDAETQAATARDLAATTETGLRAQVAELTEQVAALSPDEVLFESPGSSAKLPAGKYGGGAGLNTYFALSRPVDKAKLTYKLTFRDPFDWVKGGKIPGLEGVVAKVSPTFPTGGKADPDNSGWSGRLMWLTPISGTWKLSDGTKRQAKAPAELVGYIYHPGQSDAYGDNIWTGYVPVAGQPIDVEITYEMNTVGKADGVLQISFDGKLLVDLHNFVYRVRSDLHITHLLDQRFPGGSTSPYASKADRWIDVADYRVTTPAQ